MNFCIYFASHIVIQYNLSINYKLNRHCYLLTLDMSFETTNIPNFICFNTYHKAINPKLRIYLRKLLCHKTATALFWHTRIISIYIHYTYIYLYVEWHVRGLWYMSLLLIHHLLRPWCCCLNVWCRISTSLSYYNLHRVSTKWHNTFHV